MVREFHKEDIDRVAELWLDANLKAHNFISEQYWRGHLETVRQMILQAEVYVYEEESGHRVDGFIGLDADFVAGIFVWEGAQSCGIGKQLMDFAKGIKKQLRLCVYRKNARAIKFYQREGFRVQCESMEEGTGEQEYVMYWNG